MLVTGICIALVLWFYMFSPWTTELTNFWLNMSCSAIILTTVSMIGLHRGCSYAQPDKSCTSAHKGLTVRNIVVQVLLGIALAFVLWAIFWIGDKLSQVMFDFARNQVDNVYGMKEGTSPTLIALLLLLLIGPAEELFWRGFVQKSMCDRMNPTTAFIVTTLIYALAHIWSFNFMLVMAALVAGAVWGFLYRIKPSLLPALIVSHALWDALVFVIIPI